MIKLHTSKTLNNYTKKQLIYYCQELEKRCNELEGSFNSQYDFIKHFASEHKSDLVIKIGWKNRDDSKRDV